MARVIAFIPVRGGSQSIPLKNIKELAGKPLVLWTAEAAANCTSIDEVIIATDSDEISHVVQKAGLPKTHIYRRSTENATNISSTESVILEYLNAQNLPPETVLILVQATSPFTQSHHFHEALLQLKNSKSDSLLSCVRSKRFYWNADGTPINYNYEQRPRRQEFPGCLMENGAFYINNVGNIKNTLCRLSGKIDIYVMPDYTGLEIDEPSDWIIAETFLKSTTAKNNYCDIRIMLSDVDGVLTDGSMYYSEHGDELKKFSTYDGVGFRLLKEQGIITGLLTSECTKLVAKRSAKLKLDYCIQGAYGATKLQHALEICKENNLELSQVAYIGDDIGDIELLQHVGFPFCPANASENVLRIPGIHRLTTPGGSGCIRDLAEKILCRA